MDNISDNNAAPGISTVPTDITNDTGSGNQLDPLAGFTIGENGEKLEFNANSTISTSDSSSVGDYSEIKQPEQPAPEPAKVEIAPEKKPKLVISDPAKMDFVKTYTKEYDDVVASATHAVESILNSIDKTVREHTNEITIPEEAASFLEEKIEGGKVSKFDDAQSIVHKIMNKASQAKREGEQAAAEAARIYDGIQQFKKQTRAEIASIRNRDEFGQPKDESKAFDLVTSADDDVSAVMDDVNSTSTPNSDEADVEAILNSLPKIKNNPFIVIGTTHPAGCD